MTPSACAERCVWAPGRRFLPALLLADALLIAHMAGNLLLSAVALAAALALSGWSGMRGGRHAPRPVGRVAASLQITALGGLGMLVGLVFDAGPLGVIGLVAMCNASGAAVPGLDALLRHLHYMPWASLGMIAGCALSATAVERSGAGPRTRRPARYTRHLVTGVGMLSGMLWAESMAINYGSVAGESTSLLVAFTLVLMLAGMFVGTLGAAWLLRQKKAAREHSASLIYREPPNLLTTKPP